MPSSFHQRAHPCAAEPSACVQSAMSCRGPCMHTYQPALARARAPTLDAAGPDPRPPPPNPRPPPLTACAAPRRGCCEVSALIVACLKRRRGDVALGGSPMARHKLEGNGRAAAVRAAAASQRLLSPAIRAMTLWRVIWGGATSSGCRRRPLCEMGEPPRFPTLVRNSVREAAERRRRRRAGRRRYRHGDSVSRVLTHSCAA
eukprot:364312-Chlamydomonas_euryale.AAC.5